MTPTTTYTDTTERHVSKEALREALTSELARREASKSLLGYNVYTQPGYIPSRFHKYLCDTIEEFMNRPQPNGFDILLLSTPPQHGKSSTVTESLPAYWLGKHPDKSGWLRATTQTSRLTSGGKTGRNARHLIKIFLVTTSDLRTRRATILSSIHPRVAACTLPVFWLV